MKNGFPTVTGTILWCLVLLLVTGWFLRADDENEAGRVILLRSQRVQPGRIFFPPGYDKSKPCPLVVGIHGKGGTAAGFSTVWQRIKKKNFIFVVPEAPYEYGGGRLNRPAFNWFYMTKNRKVWEWADPITVDYLIDVCSEIRKKYRISEIVLLGFSEGVAAAYMTAFTHPDEIAGVIAFAGILPMEGMFPDEKVGASARKVKVFIAHGKRDRAIGVTVSQKALKRLKGLGFDVRFSTFTGGHMVDGDVLNRSLGWILPR